MAEREQDKGEAEIAGVQLTENVATSAGLVSCAQSEWAVMSKSSAGSASRTTKRFNSDAAVGPSSARRRHTKP